METNTSNQMDGLMKEIKKPKEFKSTFINIPLDKKEFKEKLKKPWRFFKK